MLESLDADYKRDEDWCSTERANTGDKANYLLQLINKHNEQKEAFLKVRGNLYLWNLITYNIIYCEVDYFCKLFFFADFYHIARNIFLVDDAATLH